MFRIPFSKAYDGPKIPYEDRKARFGRQRFAVEGGGVAGVAQRVGCVGCYPEVMLLNIFVYS